jgi:RimK family alpha-L-glutamate ligase
MNVLILSARTGWHTDELCRALAAHGIDIHVAAYERLVAHIGAVASIRAAPQAATGGAAAGDAVRVLEADAVVARIIPDGSLEQIIYRVDALHWIEDRGIPVINPARAIERSVDKFYTTALLHEAGLPTPETVVCEGPADAMAAVIRILDDGAEAIIKPLFGSMGHGLVRVSDREVAWRVIRTLTQLKSVLYVQRAIEHRGVDIRAFVVGGRVLGAIERTAAAGDWRTNVARGGTARAIELARPLRQMAVRAAAAVGAEYAGVDLIESHQGQAYVIEVNAIPGWQGLQRATGIDVAAAIVDHLVERLQSGVRTASIVGPA